MFHSSAKQRIAAIAIVLAALTACTPMTALRQHPEFDVARNTIERVAILPPVASVEKIMFAGDNETLHENEKKYPKSLANQARTKLRSRGYATSLVDLVELAEQDPDVAFQVEQIRNAYKAASRELYEENVAEDDYKRFTVSLGPVVNPVADIAEADALLLITYEGITKSDGQVNKERAANVLLGALTGVYYEPVRSASAIEVAMIDGASGDILWVNTEARAGLGTSVLSMAMKPLPGGSMQELIAQEDAAAEAERKVREEQRQAELETMTPDEVLNAPASWQ